MDKLGGRGLPLQPSPAIHSSFDAAVRYNSDAHRLSHRSWLALPIHRSTWTALWGGLTNRSPETATQHLRLLDLAREDLGPDDRAERNLGPEFLRERDSEGGLV